MCDSGIQGHTNGSTRTYVYIQQEQYNDNKCYGMCNIYIVIYETPYYVFLKDNFQWFVWERANKIILNTSSKKINYTRASFCCFIFVSENLPKLKDFTHNREKESDMHCLPTNLQKGETK